MENNKVPQERNIVHPSLGSIHCLDLVIQDPQTLQESVKSIINNFTEQQTSKQKKSLDFLKLMPPETTKKILDTQRCFNEYILDAPKTLVAYSHGSLVECTRIDKTVQTLKIWFPGMQLLVDNLQKVHPANVFLLTWPHITSDVLKEDNSLFSDESIWIYAYLTIKDYKLIEFSKDTLNKFFSKERKDSDKRPKNKYSIRDIELPYWPPSKYNATKKNKTKKVKQISSTAKANWEQKLVMSLQQTSPSQSTTTMNADQSKNVEQKNEDSTPLDQSFESDLVEAVQVQSAKKEAQGNEKRSSRSQQDTPKQNREEEEKREHKNTPSKGKRDRNEKYEEDEERNDSRHSQSKSKKSHSEKSEDSHQKSRKEKKREEESSEEEEDRRPKEKKHSKKKKEESSEEDSKHRHSGKKKQKPIEISSSEEEKPRKKKHRRAVSESESDLSSEEEPKRKEKKKEKKKPRKEESESESEPEKRKRHKSYEVEEKSKKETRRREEEPSKKKEETQSKKESENARPSKEDSKPPKENTAKPERLGFALIDASLSSPVSTSSQTSKKEKKLHDEEQKGTPKKGRWVSSFNYRQDWLEENQKITWAAKIKECKKKDSIQELYKNVLKDLSPDEVSQYIYDFTSYIVHYGDIEQLKKNVPDPLLAIENEPNEPQDFPESYRNYCKIALYEVPSVFDIEVPKLPKPKKRQSENESRSGKKRKEKKRKTESSSEDDSLPATQARDD